MSLASNPRSHLSSPSFSLCSRDLSAAIWKPDMGLAQVVLNRGRIISHLGFIQGGKHNLFPEEMTYMADRGSLLVFAEEDGGSKKRLLSVQECHDILLNTGYDEDTYLVFCKLLRAGYVVQRHPGRWFLTPGEDHKAIWRLWYECTSSSGALKGEEQVKTTTSTNGNGISKYETFKPPPEAFMPKKKKRKIHKEEEGEDGEEKDQAHHHHRQWWTSTSAQLISTDTLPRCVIVEEKDEKLNALNEEFPNMIPLQQIGFDALLSPGDISEGKKLLHLDVYPPNPSFGRKDHGLPHFIVCTNLGKQKKFPSVEEIASAQLAAGGVPVKFAGVEMGDIGLYGFNHIDLATIF